MKIVAISQPPCVATGLGEKATEHSHAQYAHTVWFLIKMGIPIRGKKREGRGEPSPLSAVPPPPFPVHVRLKPTVSPFLLALKAWVKLPLPGSENFSGKLRKKWQAKAGTNFTKPGNGTLAHPCTQKCYWARCLGSIAR